MKTYFVKLIERKLFLCSRDIQVGDQCLHHHPKHVNFNTEVHIIEDLNHSHYKPYEVRTNNGYGPRESYFKVIGEVSPDAEWVKEEMEFEETEVAYTWHAGTNSQGLWRIKCPCCKVFN